MATPSARLQQAADLIKAGDRAAAYTILREIIPQMPNDWRAWWSLAHASTNPNERVQALQRVIKLKPDHAKAAEMLGRLQAAQPSAASVQPRIQTPPQPAQPSGGAIQPLSSVRQPVSPPQPAAPAPWESDDPFPEAAVAPAHADAEPWGNAQPWNQGGGSSPFAPVIYEPPRRQIEDNPFDAAVTRSGAFDPWGAGSSSSAPPVVFGSAGSVVSGSVGRPLAPASPASAAPETKKFAVIMVGVAGVLILVAVVLVVLSVIRGGGNLFGGGAPNNFTGGDPYRTVGGGTMTVDGEPVTASIRGINDAHNWTFEGFAGQTVEITAVTLDQCDPRIKLLNPTGGMLAIDDDGGGFPNSYIVYTLPVDGVYTVRVDVFHVGSYQLAVRDY